MAQKHPRQPTMSGGPGKADRPFPPEAYEYSDDVTPEGVQQMRDRSGVDVTSGNWKLIDGFGRILNA